MKFKWILATIVVLPLAVVVAGVAILSSLDFEEYRGLAENEVKSATGRDFRIAGPIDLKFFPTLAVAVEDVSFANAEWAGQAPMLSLKSLDVEVELLALLGGEIQVKRLVFIDPEILLETDAEGRGNWQFDIARKAEESGGATSGAADGGDVALPRFDQLVLRGGRLTYRDGASGQEVRLAIEELTGKSQGSAGELELTMTGSYNEAPIALDANFGAIAKLVGGEAFPLRVTAKAGGAEVGVTGQVSGFPDALKLELQVTAAGQSLADLMPLAGTPLPPLGPYSLSSHVGQEGAAYVLSALALKMGNSDLTGSASLSLAGDKPKIQASLAAQFIDLADFTAQADVAGDTQADTSAGSMTAAAPPSEYVFTEEPLPLEGLQAVNADIELIAKKVKLQDKLSLQDIEIKIVLSNGRLQVSPGKTGFASGTVEFALDLDAAKASPSLEFQLGASKVNYGQLLKDLELEDSIAGEVDLDIKLAGSGGSLRAIASSLDGYSQIVSQDGVINNRLLKLISVDLGDIMGPIMGDEKDAKLECIVSRFDIAGGQATSRALVLDSEVVSLIGQGGIDLSREILDLSFDTKTSDASIASLAIPFLVQGRLKEPRVLPNPAALVAGVATTVSSLSGGDVLLGAVGSVIGGGTASGGASEAPPCAVALHAVGLGPVPVAAKPQPAAAGPAPSDAVGQTEDAAEDATKNLGGSTGDVVKGLKGLLGND